MSGRQEQQNNNTKHNYFNIFRSDRQAFPLYILNFMKSCMRAKKKASCCLPFDVACFMPL